MEQLHLNDGRLLMLVKRNLGLNANEYIEAVLSFDSILCRCLRDIVKSKNKDIGIYAFLPDSLDVENIMGYDKGGVYERAASYLPKYLLEKYGFTEEIVFLFDDVMSSPSDDYLIQEESAIFNIGSEVYHFCGSDNISEESLEKLIWACGVSWHFVCVVMKDQGNKLVTDGMSESALCKSVQDGFLEIIVGAFDGEGYVHYSAIG